MSILNEIKKEKYIISVILLVLTTFITVRSLPFAYDDAYIHFRIAENLTQANQPFYNIGERVMATSSPVWTYLLSIINLTGLSLPLAIAVINPLLLVLGGVFWVGILEQSAIPKRFIVIFHLAYAGLLIPSCAGLMETPLAICLAGAGLLLLTKDRVYGLAFISLAVFTRLELIVLAAILVVYLLYKRKTLPILLLLTSLVLLATITWSTYDTIIPHTAKAKQVVYHLSVSQTLYSVINALIPSNLLIQHFTPTLKNLINPSEYIKSLLKAAPIIITLAIIAFYIFRAPWPSITKKHSNKLNLLIGVTGIIISFTYIAKHVFLHPWYTPLFTIPILLLSLVIASEGRKIHRSIFYIISLSSLFTLSQYILGSLSARCLPTKESGARVQRYIQIGKFLYTQFPGARLMTSEIGGLGYTFKGYIYDGAGLISPNALKFFPEESDYRQNNNVGGYIPTGFIQSESPELIVTYPVFIEEFSSSRYAENYYCISIPAFSQQFQSATGSKSIWSCNELLIYIRKDVMNSDELSSITRLLNRL